MSELNRREAMAVGAAAVACPPMSGSLYERLRQEIAEAWPQSDDLDGLAHEAAARGMTQIRQARFTAGLSLAQAAQRSGVARWLEIENGHDVPDFNEGMAICRLLRMEPDALFEAVS